MAKNSQFPHILMPNIDKFLPPFQRQKFQLKKDKNNPHIKPRQLMQIIKNKKAYYEQKVIQNSSKQQIDSQNEQNQVVFPLVVNMKKNIQSKEDFGMKTKYKLFSLEESFLTNKKIGDQNDKSERSLIQKINTSIQQTQQTASNSHSRHMRMNTQNTAQKKQNNLSKVTSKRIFSNSKSLNKTFKIKPLIYTPPVLNQAQIKKQLEILCSQIPKKITQRKQEDLIGIVKFLQDYNPFFTKLSKVVCICLFKICRIFKMAQNDIIYKMNKPVEQFYIILHGRVKLSNSGIHLKRICQAGQTICEQIVMNQKSTSQSSMHFPLQKGRILAQSYLLQITIQNYKKLQEQLTVFGYKIDFNEFQAQIKRNYIVKNMLRSQKNKF